MKTLKVNGIIIAENNMGDFDKMVTLLTPNLGKISCSARGARRPKSQLMAGTQFLCFGEYMLFKGSDTYTINSCDPIEVFYNIRTDYDKLMCAAEITKLIKEVTTENQNSFHTLKLFLNTIYTISETDKDLNFVTSVFKLRLAKILGFSPNVNECVSCRTKDNLTHFSFKDNGFKCNTCATQDTGAFKMSEGTKSGIIYAIKADSKKIFSFKVNDTSNKELDVISKIYLEDKLDF